MQKTKRTTTFLLSVFLFVLIQTSNAFSSTGLSLQGRIIRPDGNPVTAASVQFRIQVRSPGAEDCLMYDEIHVLDMTSSAGAFSLTVGSGSRSAAGIDGGYSIERIFANRGTLDFSATTPAACLTGNSYSPASTDKRKLNYSFNDGSGWQSLPSVAINYVPMAVEAQMVGGYGSDNMLRVENAGVPGVAPALSSAQATELMNLLNGISTVYVKPGNAVFSAAPKYAGAVTAADDIANKAYVDAQIAGGLPNVGTAGTYTKVTTDAQGRVSAGTTLAEADIPNLVTAGKVSGAAINAGEIGGSASINTTGNIVTGGTVSANTLSGNQVRVYNGANYIQFAAPALGGNTSYTLPATAGASGQVLRTDGVGVLTWVTPVSGTVTDVTASAPLASSGGATPNITISQSNTTTDGYISAVDWNTFNNKLGTASTFSGDVSGTSSTMSVDKIKGKDVVPVAYSAGQFLRYDGTNWVNAALVAGDIPAVDSAKITNDSIMDADINSAAAIARTKLANGTADHVLINDGAGVMSSEAQLAVSRGGTGASSFSANQMIIANGTGTAQQSFFCASGQVLAFGALGVAQCENVNGASQLVRLDVSSNLNAAGNINIAATKNIQLGRYTNAEETTLASGLAAGDKGRQWYNTDSNEVKYWDGAAVQTLGAVGGAVVSVTSGGLPIVIGGTATAPTVSINQSNTTTPGYLSAADWNTFNNKQTSTLNDGQMLVGNAGNVATAVTMSGDVAISNTGVAAIQTGVIVNADINAAAAIDATKLHDGSISNTEFGYLNNVSSNIQTQLDAKLGAVSNTANLANGKVWVGDGAGKAQEQTMSGDVAISNTGVAAIQAGVIEDADINAAANIAATKLGTGVVDNTEFNYLNGVTSAIQTQLDARLPLAGGTMTGAINMGTQNITNTGNIDIAAVKNLQLGRYTNIEETTLASGLVAGDKGRQWYNTDSNSVKYWDGAAVQTLGAVGGAVVSVSSAGLPITIGGTATAPTVGINQSNTTTPGFLSAADWNTFNNKLGTASTFSGDVSGTSSTMSVDKIKGKDVVPVAYSAGQFLRYDGTNWVNAALVAADIPAVDSAKITNDSVMDADINSAAAIARTKLANGTADHVLINDGAGVMSSEAQLAVSRGGTGASSFSANQMIIANGTGTAQQSFFCASGQVLAFGALGVAQCENVNGASQLVRLDVSSNLNAAGNINIAATKNIQLGRYTNAEETTLASGLVAGDKGRQWYNTDGNQIKYWDGAAVQTLGAVGGAVTSVTSGGLPIVIGGTATAPTVSINQSNTTTPGYLSAADWNTFNNKQTATLNDGQMLVGNAGNVATAVTMSGDVAISNTGVAAIQAGVIVNADINAAAAIDATKLHDGSISNTEFGYLNNVSSNIQTQLDAKLGAVSNTANLANGKLWVGDGAGKAQEQTMSGDVAISNTGVAAIQAGVIEDADINAAANITATKLGTGVVDNTEFNYLNGVTSAIQTQLDARLPLAGGTMTGAINMGAQNITNTGNIDIAVTKNIQLGRYTNAQETTLIGGLVAGDKGRQWYNTDGNQIKYWDGAAVQVLGAVGGAVTSVTSGGLPIVIGGTATAPTVSINQSNTTTPGYLSAADWNTFNNKQTSTLNDGQILVGNAGNVATAVTPSGDVTITNAGVMAIGAGVIMNADINASAAIGRSKLAVGAINHVLINDGTGEMSSEAQLGVTRGGTGQSSYTDGQLLIGNSTGNTLTKATLTQGTGSIITNGNGSITIAADYTTTAQNNKLLMLDGSGIGQAKALQVNGATSGNVLIQAPGVTTTYSLTLPANDGDNGQVLQTNGSGVTTWVTPGSPGDASYVAKGVVQFDTDAATSGITIAAGLASVNAGTGNNQIVKLDGTARLPAVDGRNLTNLDLNSNLNSNYFKQNGNSFGVAANVGTADNFGLNFKTNNLTRMALSNGGDLTVYGTGTFSSSTTFESTAAFNAAGNGPSLTGYMAPSANSGARKLMTMNLAPMPSAAYTSDYISGDFNITATSAQNQSSGGYTAVNAAISKAGAGSVNDAIAGNFTINNALGTTTNAYGVKTTISNSATTTNAYGVHIGSIQATNKWSIFSTDATAPSVFAGSVGIGHNTAPVASALLDMQSTTKGVLIPRMTTGERDSIGSPANGLQVYNTSTNKLNFYNGGSWQELGITGGGGALSSISSATAINTIDNTNYAQTWNWSTLSTQSALSVNANAITSGKVLDIASTSTGMTGTMANFALSGNNAANTGTLVKATVTGASSLAVPMMATNGGAGNSFRVNDDGTDTDSTPFVVDASGNVGIGMSSPTQALHFATGSTIRMGGTGTIDFTHNNGTRIYGNAAEYMSFYTSSSERLRIISNGNIGVGTASPTSKLHTHSTGTSSASQFTTASTGALVSDGFHVGWDDALGAVLLNKETGSLVLGTSGAESMRINSSGNVGIANINPANAKLEIGTAGTSLGTIRLAGDTSGYVQIQPASAAGSWTFTLPADDGDNGYLLQTNGSGITSWVAAPSGSSSLSALTLASATNTIDNTNYAQTWNWSTLNTQTAMSINANAVTTGSVLDIASSSASLNSANGLLRVANTGASTTGTVARIQSNSTAGSGLTVLANGNVGIGTITPGAPLEVAANSGEIRVRGSVSSAQLTLSKQSGASYNSFIDFWTGGTSEYMLGTKGTSSDFMVGPTLATPHLSILRSSGNVGIANSNPANAKLEIGTAGTSLGTMRLAGNTSGYVQIQPAAAAGSWTMTLPATDGASGEVLQTDGNGVTSWVAASGGGALSALTAATATNTIDSLNFGQTWNWTTADNETPMTINANALTTGSIIDIATSNASVNSTNGLLRVANTGASTSGVIARIQSNSTSGSGMTVLADGKVGVGTVSPVTQFDVVSSTASANVMSLRNNSASGYSGIQFIDSGGVNKGSIAYGNTTAPLFSSEMTFGTSSTDDLSLVTNGIRRITVDGPTGNVGIGTTLPQKSLHAIAGEAQIMLESPMGPMNEVGIMFNKTGEAQPKWSIFRTTWGGYDGDDLFFNEDNDSNKNRLTLRAGGNVGIGTDTPTKLLEIKGDQSSGIALINRTGAGVNNPYGTMQLKATSSVATSDGFGPSLFFKMEDSSNADSALAEIQALRDGADNTGALSFQTYTAGSQTEKLRITNAGNVGIGTTNPTSPLHVSTTNVAGNIANFVSTGAGGAGCSIAWNGASCSSDIRLKQDVVSVDASQMLNDLLSLRPVHFTWIKDPKHEKQTGFIAQEIEKYFPEFVKTDDKGFKQVNYAHFVSVLTAGVQEMYGKFAAETKELREENLALKQKSNQLEQKVQAHQKKLDLLQAYICQKEPNASVCK